MKRITFVLVSLIAALMPAVTFAQGEELPSAPEVPPAPVSSSFFDGFLLMSNEAILMMVAGVVISLIMSIPLQQAWGDDVKALLVFVACAVFGLIYTLTLDEWDTADLGRRVLLIMGAATGFYLLFKGPMQTLTTRTDTMLNRQP